MPDTLTTSNESTSEDSTQSLPSTPDNVSVTGEVVFELGSGSNTIQILETPEGSGVSQVLQVTETENVYPVLEATPTTNEALYDRLAAREPGSTRSLIIDRLTGDVYDVLEERSDGRLTVRKLQEGATLQERLNSPAVDSDVIEPDNAAFQRVELRVDPEGGRNTTYAVRENPTETSEPVIRAIELPDTASALEVANVVGLEADISDFEVNQQGRLVTLDFDRVVNGEVTTASVGVYISENYQQQRSVSEIQSDLNGLLDDLARLFETSSGQQIYDNLALNISGTGRPQTLGTLADRLPFTGSTQDTTPLPNNVNLVIALEPRIVLQADDAVSTARAFNRQAAESGNLGSVSLVQLDPRFDRGIGDVDLPVLYRQLALASEQIAGQADQVTNGSLRTTDNQIRLELDLLPVFDSRSDRAVIDQYVRQYESEVLSLEGPDAAAQISRAQDSLDSLFSRATAQQRADLSSSLLESFDSSRSPAIQEALDRHRSDVLQAYSQGNLSPQAEDTVNVLFQQLSTAQISTPDDFPQLDLTEVSTGVLSRLTLPTTADAQISTVTISADGNRTIVSQPASFNHQSTSFTRGDDLTQLQRIELEALDADLLDWFGRASTGSPDGAAISDLRAIISDVLSGAIPQQADSVMLVTSRAGDGSLGSASYYAYDGNTRTVTLTDNVVNPDTLLDLQSRPAGTFVDADASNRIAVLRDITSTYPTIQRIISETENPREIAGLNDLFFVQDELLFRQPIEGITQAQNDFLRRQGDVLVAASADLAAQAAADPRGLSATLQAEIRDLNTRLQSLDLGTTTVADLSDLGDELGLAINRARFSSTGDLESNLGPEALALGNLEVSASASNGVTRGDYVIYEQLTDVLDLTDDAVRSRSGSADDFVRVLTNDIYESSLVTAPVDEDGEIIREVANGIYNDPDVIDAFAGVYDRLAQRNLDVDAFARGLAETADEYASLEDRQVFIEAQGDGNVARLQESASTSPEIADQLDAVLAAPADVISVIGPDGEDIPQIQIVISEDLRGLSTDAELNGILRKVQGDLDVFFSTNASRNSLDRILQNPTPEIRQITDLDAFSGLSSTANRDLPAGTQLVLYLEPDFADSATGDFARALAIDPTAATDLSGTSSVIRINADYESGLSHGNATLLFREIHRAAINHEGLSGGFEEGAFTRFENQVRGELFLPDVQFDPFSNAVATDTVGDRIGFESEFVNASITFSDGEFGVRTIAATDPQFDDLGFPLLAITSDSFFDRDRNPQNDLEIVTSPASISDNQNQAGFEVRAIIQDEVNRLTTDETPLADFVDSINRRIMSELGEAGRPYILTPQRDDGTIAFATSNASPFQNASEIDGGAVQVNLSVGYSVIGDVNTGLGGLFVSENRFDLFNGAQRSALKIASELTDTSSPLLDSFLTHLLFYTTTVAISNTGFDNTNKNAIGIQIRVSLEDVVASILSPEDIAAISNLPEGFQQRLEAEVSAIAKTENLNFDGLDGRLSSVFDTTVQARLDLGQAFQISGSEHASFLPPFVGRQVIQHTIADDGGSRLPVSIVDGEARVVLEIRDGSNLLTSFNELYNSSDRWSLEQSGFREIVKVQYAGSPLSEKVIFEDFVSQYAQSVQNVISDLAGENSLPPELVDVFSERVFSVIDSLQEGRTTGLYGDDLLARLDNIVDEVGIETDLQILVRFRTDAEARIETIRSFQPTEATSLELYQTLVANADSSALRGRTGTAEDVRIALEHLAAQDGVSVVAEVQRTLDVAIQRNANGERLFTEPFAEALLAYQATSGNNGIAEDLSIDAIGQDRLEFLLNSVSDNGDLLRNFEALGSPTAGIDDASSLDPAAIAEQKLALFRAYEQVLESSGVELDTLSDFGDLNARIRFLIEADVVTDPDGVSALRAINYDFEQLNALDGDAFADIAISEQQTGILLDEGIAVARAQARLDEFEADVESAGTEFEALAIEFLGEQGIVPAWDADRATLLEAVRDSISPIVEGGFDEASLETVSRGLSLTAIGDALEDLQNAGRADGLLEALARSQQGESPQGVSGLLDQPGLLINGIDPDQTNAELVLNFNSNGNNNNNGDAVLELRLVQSGTVKTAQVGAANRSPADLLDDLDTTLSFIEAELNDPVFRQLSDEFSVNDNGRVDSVLRSTSGSADLNLIESTDRILSVATNSLDVESLQGRLLNQEFNRTFGDLVVNTQNFSAREAGNVLLDSVERAGLGQVADIYRSLLSGDNTEINRYLDEFDNPGSAAPDLDNPIWRGLADSPEAQEQILERLGGLEAPDSVRRLTDDGSDGDAAFLNVSALGEGSLSGINVPRAIAGEVFSTAFSAFGAGTAAFGLYGGLNTLLNPDAGGVRAVGAITVASSTYGLVSALTGGAISVAGEFADISRYPALAAVNPGAFVNAVESAGGTASSQVTRVAKVTGAVGNIISIGLGVYSLVENAIGADEARNNGETTRAALLGLSAALDAISIVLDVVSTVVELGSAEILKPVSIILDVINAVIGAISIAISFLIPPPGVQTQFEDYLESDAYSDRIDSLTDTYANQGFDLLQYMFDASTLGIEGAREKLEAARRDLDINLTEAAELDPENRDLRVAIIDDTGVGNLLEGRDNDDLIRAGLGDDEIYGFGGDDDIDAGDGDDLVFGGSGDDNIRGGDGNDRLFGESGEDVIRGGSGNDYIDGGADNDLLFGGRGDDEIFGGSGDDDLQGGVGNDILRGGLGNDLLRGGRGNDLLEGGDGDDLLDLGAGNDIAFAGDGDDRVETVLGINTISGDDGQDLLDLSNNTLLTNVPGLFGYVRIAPGYELNLADGSTSARLNGLEEVSPDIRLALSDELSNVNATLNQLYSLPRLEGRLFSDDPDILADPSVRGAVLREFRDVPRNFSFADQVRDPAGPLAFGIYDVDVSVRDTLESDLLAELDARAQLNRSANGIFEVGGSNFTADELSEYYRRVHEVNREYYRDAYSLGYSEKVTGQTEVSQVYANFATEAAENGRAVRFLADAQIARTITTNDGRFDGLLYPDLSANFTSGEITDPTYALEPAYFRDVFEGRVFTDGQFLIVIAKDGSELYRFDASVQQNGNVDPNSLRGQQARSEASDSLTTITDFYLLTLDILNAQASIDGIEDVVGGESDDNLTGDENDNAIYGGRGDDELDGGGGNDLLVGGLGADTVRGGAGNDLILQHDEYGLRSLEGSVDGGDGIDTISFRGVEIGGIEASVSQVGNLEIRNVENLEGTNQDDVLIGDGGSNTLTGLDGNDQLRGGDGNDALVGGAGVDTLIGGQGSDTASYSDRTEAYQAAQIEHVRAEEGLAAAETSLNSAQLRNDAVTSDLATVEELLDDISSLQLLIDSESSILGTTSNAEAINALLVTITENGLQPTEQELDVLRADGRTRSELHEALLVKSIRRLAEVTAEELVADREEEAARAVRATAVEALADAQQELDDLLEDGGLAANAETLLSQAQERVDIARSTLAEATAALASANAVAVLATETRAAAIEARAAISSFDPSDPQSIRSLRRFEDQLEEGIVSLSVRRSEELAEAREILEAANDRLRAAIEDEAFLQTAGITANLSTGENSDGDVYDSIENIVGTHAADDLTGTDSENVLSGGSGDDVLNGLGGADLLLGGAGADTIRGGDGIDTLSYLDGRAEGVSVNLETGENTDTDAISGIENVAGSDANDVLTGDNEANALSGNDGNDTLSGGGGSDTLEGGVGADVLRGGEGIDTALYSSAATGVDVDLLAGTSNDGDRLSGIENIVGSAFADNLAGDDNANTLFAGDGDDVVDGNAGADALIGGRGADTLDGGAGLDSVVYNDGRDTGVTVNLATGENSDDDILRNIEGVVGSLYDDVLEGDSQDNSLSGLSGEDRLVGGAGSDTLDGGAGADVLDGGAGSDTATYENATTGVTADLYGGANSDGDRLVDIENLTGSRFDDRLLGDDGSNRLIGNGGADTLAGQGGNDLLVGGADNDTLLGGTGNDVLVGGSGRDILNGGAGSDSVSYSTAQVGVEVDLETGENSDGDTYVSIENVEGSGFDDTLDGDTQDNVLYGLDGQDILRGGDGNDRLFGGLGTDVLEGGDDDDELSGGAGADVIRGGEGIDLLSYAERTDSGVFASLNTGENSDGDTFSGIEQLTGSRFDDDLEGDDAENLLSGGAGNDELSGLDGNDVLNGEDGNDHLDGGSGADVLIGGAGDDTLIGGDNDDLLRADEGEDHLIGGRGLDVYAISSASRNSLITAGEDVDRLAFADLRSDEIGLTLTQSGADRYLVFNQIAQNEEVREPIAIARIALASLFPEDSDLSALDNDAISTQIATAFDRIVFTDGEVSGAATQTLVVNGLEGQPLSVFAFGSGQGTDGNDVLDGAGRRDDVLVGRGGDDRLTGLSGNDRLNGGEGSDVLDGGEGLADFAIYTDANEGVTVDLEFETQYGGEAEGDRLLRIEGLDGSQFADNLSGDVQDNILLGNAGADRLDGRAGSDFLDGGDGTDHLDGGDGDDILVSRLGADTLSGGEGSDVYIVAATSGHVTLNETTLGERSSENRLVFEAIDFSTVEAQQLGDALLLTLSETASVTIEGWFAPEVPVSHAFDEFRFADGVRIDAGYFVSQVLAGLEPQILYGGDTDDRFDGTDVALTVDSGAGADTISGSNRGDDLAGGAGNDEIIANAGNDQVNLGDGNDVFRDRSEDAEATTGDDNDTVFGGAGADVFYSETGFDQIFGEAGDDQIFVTLGTGNFVVDGGTGSDTLSLSFGALPEGFDPEQVELHQVSLRLNDVVNEGIRQDGNRYVFAETLNALIASGEVTEELLEEEEEGTEAAADVVYRDIDGRQVFVLRPENSTFVTLSTQQSDVLAGAVSFGSVHGIENVSGSELNDVLTGNSGANTLTGNGGNDTLSGGGGADRLDGGIGDDQLYGGDGADRLVAQFGADLLEGGLGQDTYVIHRTARNARIDENLSSRSDTGNTLVFEDARSDEVHFVQAGTDIDIFIDRERVVTLDNIIRGGFIEAQFATISFADGVFVTGARDAQIFLRTRLSGETAKLDVVLGTDDIDVLEGDAADNTFSGLRGDDVVTGGAGNDILRGDDGDDLIDGGSGNDVLDGGEGNDLIYATEGTDRITTGAGNNRVILSSASSFSLIDAAGGTTTVDFQDLALGDVTFRRAGVDLEILNDGQRLAVVVDAWFNDFSNVPRNEVSQLIFTDGSIGLADISYERLPATFDARVLPPQPGEDVLTTQEDTAVTVTVERLLSNDTNVAETTVLSAVDNARNGTVRLEDGVVHFTPDADFNGLASFDYALTDANGITVTSTVTITVAPVEDAPEAVDDVLQAVEDTPLLISSQSLIANDMDADGDFLTLVSVQDVNGGGVEITAEGDLLFTPDADRVVPATFGYTITDHNGNQSTAQARVDIAAVNDAPVAETDFFETEFDEALSVSADQLLANDRDAEPGELTLVSVGDAVNGSVVLTAQGEVSFTPAEGFSGAARFNYTVLDAEGAQSVGTAVVNVAANTTPPDAANDQLTYQVGQILEFSQAALLANDTDYSGGGLTITSVQGAVGGSVSLGENGTIIFTPEGAAPLPAQFSYTVSDVNGNTSQGVANLNGLAAQQIFLSDYSAASSVNGWGPIKFNGANDTIGGEVSTPLLLDGNSYDTGIGVHAGSEVVYDLRGGDFSQFTALIGVDDSRGIAGSVEFQVFVDDVLQFSSGLVTGASAAREILVNIDPDAEKLTLAVIDGNDGRGNDNANWANAALTLARPDGTISSEGLDHVVNGTGDADWITAGAGSQSLYGGWGEDSISAGAGDDFVDGGFGSDSSDGGTGVDTVSFERSIGTSDTRGIRIDVNSGNTFLINRDESLAVDSIWERHTNFENVIGSHNNDVITGSQVANVLTGGEGDDRIDGRQGNDLIDGGRGTDVTDGGDGNDTISFATALGSQDIRSIDFSLGDGNAYLLNPDGTRTFAAVWEAHVNFENVVGSFNNDRLLGDQNANELSGEDGNDRLEGGGGADTLNGGRGRDILVGGSGADTFAFRRGDNVDTIRDFQDGTDVISFADQGLSFEDLFIFSDASGVYVVYGPGDEILLEGVAENSLNEEDFAFYP